MDYVKIHEKWRKTWAANGAHKFTPNSKKPPYYCLEMLPYPSGATLHIGHFYMYALPDTHVRFKHMCGYNVFQPMGFDAFGLPAENHALKTNTHPHDNTLKNMEIMKRQFEQIGGIYDWDYSVTTCFPDYYKWNQWLFLQLYKSGLAYQKDAPVNWCDKCKTVLANEQVLSGACERCESTVTRKNMKQWFLKITDYADKLLAGLDTLDWPAKTKAMQRNWIGKSIGARIQFDDLVVFTTRPDTLSCATFIAIAGDTIPTCEKGKHGKFTGKYVTNPYNGKKIPVWEADYVISTYGTGAVMGVPAHDERDREFAEKYNIPIATAPALLKQAEWEKFGTPFVNYRLRDWSIGRQRYWGTPIPIIYCDKCGIVPVPEKDLPVMLPHIKDFKPKGAAPLASVPEFINCKCPTCGKSAKRECDTMDTFVCSSWYFLRYPYAKRNDVPFEKTAPQPNVCIGGPEHSCGHLIYSRFITRFLCEKGFIKFPEPFPKLIHQGLILAPDGQKMSKSKNNFITPDVYVDKYGSDVLRLFMLFGFNFVDGGPWDESILKTVTRFIERIETLIKSLKPFQPGDIQDKDKEILYIEHSTIKSVRDDLENFSFNTAVARCMELLNGINDYAKKTDATPCIVNHCTRTLVKLVAPMLPHIAEEFHEMLGEKTSVFAQPFPIADEKYLVRDSVEIAVQINSKIVARITVPSSATQSTIEKLCAKYTKGVQVKKVVYVKNRLINFIGMIQ